jgi:aminomethyltransferase
MTRSPLHDQHVALGGTLIDFAGWQLPVRYSGDLAEHHAVRTAAGLFDLSHMGEFMVSGPDAAAFLDYALVGHMSRVGLGRAKYTMICQEDGGAIDDLVVYRRDWDTFMVVANAANVAVVLGELTARLEGFDATIEDETLTVALIAVQGPLSAGIVADMCLLGDDDVHALKYYAGVNIVLEGGIHAFCARTGYTGEDGYELFVGADEAPAVWQLALAAGRDAGIVPCGLASRDTLRLEAGMPLYGQELSREITPVQAGLGRIVNLGTEAAPRGDFVGRAALERALAAPPDEVLVGLAGQGRRAARTGYSVVSAEGTVAGAVTSGAPSPTLGHQIAMAYVPTALSEIGTEVQVDVRGRGEPMSVVALPFYKRG